MPKKRKAVAEEVVAGRGMPRRLARLEKRLARLASEEAKRARQLDEVRARQDEVRARIAALGAGVVVEAPVATAAAGPSQAVPEAYCMREKRKVAIAGAELVVLRNGRGAYAGTCPGCGARVLSIVGIAPAD